MRKRSPTGRRNTREEGKAGELCQKKGEKMVLGRVCTRRRGSQEERKVGELAMPEGRGGDGVGERMYE